MNKDEQLARLLRLKRHEKPEADYFDGFLDEFHAYQRRSLASQSAASLWWERLGTTLSVFRRPATAWVAIGAYAGIMLLIHTWPAPDHAAKTTVVISGNSAANANPPPVSPVNPATSPETFRSWQPAFPADQTIPVSEHPGLKPPVAGKRRTVDQPPDLNTVGAPVAPPEVNPKPG